MQENTKGCLEMDEGNPVFQLLKDAETAAMTLFIFINTTYIIKFPIYLFLYSGL
jgi:hypothetical protein